MRHNLKVPWFLWQRAAGLRRSICEPALITLRFLLSERVGADGAAPKPFSFTSPSRRSEDFGRGTLRRSTRASGLVLRARRCRAASWTVERRIALAFDGLTCSDADADLDRVR